MTETVGVLDSHHLREVLQATATRLGERCGKDAIDLLRMRLAESIGQPSDDDYSYVSRSAIEDHEQDRYKHSHRDVLIDALRDTTLSVITSNDKEAVEAIEELLLSPYPTLVRIGIFICGERYGTVGPVFWKCFKRDWLTDVSCWHEIFWFIRKAFPRFSAVERATFLEAVASARGKWKDDERAQELDEVHRRDLLFAAAGLGDAEVDSLFETLVKRRGPVRQHPDFHAYSQTGWVEDRSPVTADELVRAAPEALVRLMNTFAPDPSAWDGPTYRGFADSLSSAVRKSLDGFADRLQLFESVPRPFQHGVLRGLKERWAEDKRDIDWPSALALMQTLVSVNVLKKDVLMARDSGWEPSVHWVISDVASLIKARVSDPSRPGPPEENSKCVEILKAILAATTPSEATGHKDAVFDVINSPRGQALEALILLALAIHRQEADNQAQPSIAWSSVGAVFDEELETSAAGHNAEFATSAGLYCANLHYLNSQWVVDNFDRLFSLADVDAWNCAAQGFAYQHYVYPWLYDRLVRGGHLRRMVFADSLPDNVSEKALQFLGLAYLEGMEQLRNNGLLSELIVTLRVKELSYLCWFFWTLRGERESVRGSLILEFWSGVVATLRTKGVVEPELRSALNLLSSFIREITPALELTWSEIAPHAHVAYHGHELVENLARLAPKFPEAVANVFRAALMGFLPDYDPDDIITCVKKIGAGGRWEDAEWICNEYSRRGSTLLKDTYSTLRNRQLILPTSDNETGDASAP